MGVVSGQKSQLQDKKQDADRITQVTGVSVEHESAKAVGIESGKAVGQIQLDDLPRRPKNQAQSR